MSITPDGLEKKMDGHVKSIKIKDGLRPNDFSFQIFLFRLVTCLRDFGPTDWQLACLVCKTLWNFSENITNASSFFGDEDTNTLLVLLSSFLGKIPQYGSVNAVRGK